MGMEFGEILDQWEKGRGQYVERKKSQPFSKKMEQWLDQYPVEEQSKTEPEIASKKRKIRERALLLSMKHEAEIDLHGLTVTEAITRLETFIISSRRRGLKKILIIHGKGHHSPGEPVLKKEVKRFIETCPYTGQFGVPSRYGGGSGALWVILK